MPRALHSSHHACVRTPPASPHHPAHLAVRRQASSSSWLRRRPLALDGVVRDRATSRSATAHGRITDRLPKGLEGRRQPEQRRRACGRSINSRHLVQPVRLRSPEALAVNYVSGFLDHATRARRGCPRPPRAPPARARGPSPGKMPSPRLASLPGRTAAAPRRHLWQESAWCMDQAPALVGRDDSRITYNGSVPGQAVVDLLRYTVQRYGCRPAVIGSSGPWR